MEAFFMEIARDPGHEDFEKQAWGFKVRRNILAACDQKTDSSFCASMIALTSKDASQTLRHRMVLGMAP